MNTPLSEDEMRSRILRLLGEIAPEADTTSLRPDVSFRDQLDLDSMDFLNFVVALHKEFHIEIPESDYPKYMTLNGCLAQLSAARS
ncbi:MAG: acyl carrier protein [Nitrospira sp.]|jgi:acyl carrier protein|uniref:acyl carrier protein n=1 Tax=Nitrospira sp. ND1 TaxID=1658518 RepID=UPI0009B963D0|nr:acyl carrier protein [Nitrospira sp. ND1]MBK7417885.1 acyl carrier protein [Nitrospira sp.]OYT22937.1 MAG: acyl carrier protein [Nitrospira sp. UW-LDO-02]MBK7485117.1 acyl carrier protein [Nitrospira sp.]MBK9112435.1 acyl carrier protein [Nitrospira sp.]MBK9995814.1 acyl carrier protein [Nitrospira sp.]